MECLKIKTHFYRCPIGVKADAVAQLVYQEYPPAPGFCDVFREGGIFHIGGVKSTAFIPYGQGQALGMDFHFHMDAFAFITVIAVDDCIVYRLGEADQDIRILLRGNLIFIRQVFNQFFNIRNAPWCRGEPPIRIHQWTRTGFTY